jgi:pSer/pThr/pTyr-binding forkhead associated (FHA) protein
MAAHRTLDQFIATFSPRVQDRFLAQFPHPLVVVDMGTEVEVPPEAAKSQTHAPDGGLTAFEVSDLLEQAGILVAQVVKSKRNNFQAGVTVGRAPNNDIILPHQAVSKFHAFFAKNAATGGWEIQDVNSRYGTMVERVTVPPGGQRPIRSGSNILIAKYVKMTFFTPKDLYSYLHLLLHKRKQG